MGIGNTFGATVLSSYGGFWISVGITFTPGGFNIMSVLEEADEGSLGMFYNSFGLMLFVSLHLATTLQSHGLIDMGYLGLVYLYHINAPPDSEINHRVLFPILCCRHSCSPHGNWVSSPRLHG